MKTILLKTLTLNNFLSHEKTDIAFETDGKILVDGISGSGKSSIIEGIVWALYGKARTDNRSLVRRGAEKATVTVELSSDTGPVVIRRAITNAGKHTLSVEVGGKAHELYNLRDLQTWIEKDLIGASYTLFVNSVAYLQNSPDLFILQNAAKRKELLLEIVDVENFDVLADKSRKVYDDLDKRKQILDADLVRNKETISDIEERMIARPGLLAKLAGTTSAIKLKEENKTKISDELAILKSQGATVDAYKAAVRAHKASELQALNDVAALVNAKAKLEGLPRPSTTPEECDVTLKRLEAKRIALRLEDKKRIDMFVTRPRETVEEFDLTGLRRQIELLSINNQCPSGDKCPHQEGSHQRLEILKSDLVSREKKRTKEQAEKVLWEKVYDSMKDCQMDIINLDGKIETCSVQRNALVRLISDREQLEEEIKRLLPAQTRLETCSDEVKKAEKQLANAERLADVSRLGAVTQNLLNVNESLRKWRAEEASLATQIGVIESHESQLPTKIAEGVTLNVKIVALSLDMDKVKRFQTALGSKGLKQVVVDYLLPRLEEKINEVLAQMSDFRIHLDTQKPSVDGEGIVEGLFITIINDLGEEMAWENYSGGERLKITVAISEALASLQKVGFRIFDETFVGLDDNATEDFAGVVGRLQRRFNQVLMISHLTAVKGMFENTITIRKTNGISYVNGNTTGTT